MFSIGDFMFGSLGRCYVRLNNSSGGGVYGRDTEAPCGRVRAGAAPRGPCLIDWALGRRRVCMQRSGTCWWDLKVGPGTQVPPGPTGSRTGSQKGRRTPERWRGVGGHYSSTWVASKVRETNWGAEKSSWRKACKRAPRGRQKVTASETTATRRTNDSDSDVLSKKWTASIAVGVS